MVLTRQFRSDIYDSLLLVKISRIWKFYNKILSIKLDFFSTDAIPSDCQYPFNAHVLLTYIIFNNTLYFMKVACINVSTVLIYSCTLSLTTCDRVNSVLLYVFRKQRNLWNLVVLKVLQLLVPVIPLPLRKSLRMLNQVGCCCYSKKTRPLKQTVLSLYPFKSFILENERISISWN